MSDFTMSSFTREEILEVVKEYRKLREEAYKASLKLRGANLAGIDLSEAHLHGADLWAADLSGANLSSANLYEARYNENTKFSENFDPYAEGMELVE